MTDFKKGDECWVIDEHGAHKIRINRINADETVFGEAGEMVDIDVCHKTKNEAIDAIIKRLEKMKDE